VIKLAHWALSAAVALALTSGAAMAQKAPETKKETAAPAAQAKKKVAKKAPSPCAGLAQEACTANPVCSWYKEITTKKGQKRKAHCQKKPTPPAKKAAPADKGKK
jgi:oxalate decarboxylase/phosphoglucose isomerase-like protein (cupin superfamily)